MQAFLKLLLDAVFGALNFRTEIVWKRSSAHSDAKQGRRQHGRIHDVILFYTKSDDHTWTTLYTDYDDAYVEKFYRHVEEGTNRRYQLSDLTGPGVAAGSGARVVSSRPDGATIADALGLRRRGSEWVGPCPRCGGTDRFHVRADGVFGCRVCGEDDNAGLYRAIMDACGYDSGTDTDTWRPSQRPATRRRPEPKANTGPGLRGVAQAAWGAAMPTTNTPAQRSCSEPSSTSLRWE